MQSLFVPLHFVLEWCIRLSFCQSAGSAYGAHEQSELAPLPSSKHIASNAPSRKTVNIGTRQGGPLHAPDLLRHYWPKGQSETDASTAEGSFGALGETLPSPSFLPLAHHPRASLLMALLTAALQVVTNRRHAWLTLLKESVKVHARLT